MCIVKFTKEELNKFIEISDDKREYRGTFGHGYTIIKNNDIYSINYKRNDVGHINILYCGDIVELGSLKVYDLYKRKNYATLLVCLGVCRAIYKKTQVRVGESMAGDSSITFWAAIGFSQSIRYDAGRKLDEIIKNAATRNPIASDGIIVGGKGESPKLATFCVPLFQSRFLAQPAPSQQPAPSAPPTPPQIN